MGLGFFVLSCFFSSTKNRFILEKAPGVLCSLKYVDSINSRRGKTAVLNPSRDKIEGMYRNGEGGGEEAYYCT